MMTTLPEEVVGLVDQLNAAMNTFRMVQDSIFSKVDTCIKSTREMEEKINNFITPEFFVQILKLNKERIEKEMEVLENDAKALIISINKYETKRDRLQRAAQEICNVSNASANEFMSILKDWQDVLDEYDIHNAKLRLHELNTKKSKHEIIICKINLLLECFSI